MASVLSPARARKFYDHFGSRQDAQAFYEEAALAKMVSHAAFETAERTFELGCGTGRLARELLERRLAPTARYFGADISTTMVRLSRARLEPWPSRALVVQADASVGLPFADGSVDRFVATYVLDLLSDATTAAVVAEAVRMLVVGGQLCLVGITHGRTFGSRLAMSLWTVVHRLSPRAVGGCRPISMQPLLEPSSWRVEAHCTVSAFSIASEVLVASKLGVAARGH